MSWVLLALGGVALLHVVNAWAPRKGRLTLLWSFFASWLAIELAPFWTVLTAGLTAVLVVGGALQETPGVVGLVLSVLAVAGFVVIMIRARRTVLVMRGAMADLELEPDPEPGANAFPRSHVVLPFLMNRREGTRTIRNIEYRRASGKVLKLDVVLPTDAKPGERRPALLQIHGGAWVIGDKREQGIPLMRHMAANGWVCFNPNYRLSPAATFPDHLVDLKAAIAWIRGHAEELGADPDYLAVTGGSAGGHLAALVALTANDPEYQPGFEDVDTTIRAAVPFYGVYDFTNRLGTWHRQTITRFWQPLIIKRDFEAERWAYEKASPLDQIHEEAPPFLVIHGDLDTLAPVADCRLFVERLREVSRHPVLYAEMKGAQHAFDVFPSYRTARVIESVERFLTTLWQHDRRSGRGEQVAEERALADVVGD